MPALPKFMFVKLTAAQIATLAELSKSHAQLAYVYMNTKTNLITVEFEFPYRYIIASNGRPIEDFA
jgi:hypothetical protein